MNKLQLTTLLCLLLLVATSAWAQSDGVDRQGAADAYDKGTAAYLTGNYERAAGWFETAHRLAPAAAALQQAVKAYQKAGDEAHAATLALELQENYADTDQARQLADKILQQARFNLVFVEVSCDHCELAVDDKVHPRPSFFVRPETSHQVVGTFSTGQTREDVEAGHAGDTIELTLEKPSPDPIATARPEPPPHEPIDIELKSEPPEANGLPPYVTLAAAGVTGVLLVATVAQGVAANSKGTSYDTAVNNYNACLSGTNVDCMSLYNYADTRLKVAQGAEGRTNALVAATLVTGAATAIIGIFFTDWGEKEGPSAQFALAPDGSTYGHVRMAF